MVKRRNFITVSSTLAFTTAFGKGQSSESSSNKISGSSNGVYKAITKFGNYKTDSLCSISVFQTRNKGTILKNVLSVLDKHNYRSEIKYSSNDKFKVGTAKDLIDLFFVSDVFVRIGVRLNPRLDFLGMSPAKFNEKIISEYSELLYGSISSPVHIKCENKYGASDFFIDEFNRKTGDHSLVIVFSKEDRIMQFADLITGIITSCLTEKPRTKVKEEINKYFMQKIGVDKLNFNSSIKEKFEIIRF